MSAAAEALTLVSSRCCLCPSAPSIPIATGEDFEYRTTPDLFLAVQCSACKLVYLSLRPHVSELDRIYPSTYHAYDFTPDHFGFVYRVRRRLEARRLLRACVGLPENARILDVGCGDAFHLGLLRDFGQPGWRLEGVDASARAMEAAARNRISIHHGLLDEVPFPKSSYDLVFLIATIEHVSDPPALLASVRRLLKPGGRVVIVTDNTATLDFWLFKGRHWGGYHFPRHWHLFNSGNLRLMAENCGLDVHSLDTLVSPVNWVYSIRNMLVDLRGPDWLIRQFSLESSPSLGAFTIVDNLFRIAGRGALLRADLRKPYEIKQRGKKDAYSLYPMSGAVAKRREQ